MTVFSFSWPLAVAVQVDIAEFATGQVAFMLASFTMQKDWCEYGNIAAFFFWCENGNMLASFTMAPWIAAS